MPGFLTIKREALPCMEENDMLTSLATQPTLSHHMKLLCDADIVQGRKEGKWVHYSINPEGAKRAQKILTHFVTSDNANEQDDNFCGE